LGIYPVRIRIIFEQQDFFSWHKDEPKLNDQDERHYRKQEVFHFFARSSSRMIVSRIQPHARKPARISPDNTAIATPTVIVFVVEFIHGVI